MHRYAETEGVAHFRQGLGVAQTAPAMVIGEDNLHAVQRLAPVVRFVRRIDVLRARRIDPGIVSTPLLEPVNAGMGLALVPRCATSVVSRNVVFREIDLGEGLQSELHLIWRENNDNPAFAMLPESIRRAVKDGWG